MVGEGHGVQVKPIHPLGFRIHPESDPDVDLIQKLKDFLPAIVPGLIAATNILKLIRSIVDQLNESWVGQ